MDRFWTMDAINNSIEFKFKSFHLSVWNFIWVKASARIVHCNNILAYDIQGTVSSGMKQQIVLKVCVMGRMGLTLFICSAQTCWLSFVVQFVFVCAGFSCLSFVSLG